jgi:hypothetical protein
MPPAQSNSCLGKRRIIRATPYRGQMAHALPIIGTKDFLETWADFVSAWGKVKTAAGQGAIDLAFHRARERPKPRMAEEMYGSESPIVPLVALCCELQGMAGNADFFLDCRTAGLLLGVSHKVAWSWLRILVADGILELRSVGSQATHRASRYRYAGR